MGLLSMPWLYAQTIIQPRRWKVNCKCKDWEENISKVNSGFMMTWVHGGTGYDGKVFVYCPWCGSELTNQSEKLNGDV